MVDGVLYETATITHLCNVCFKLRFYPVKINKLLVLRFYFVRYFQINAYSQIIQIFIIIYTCIGNEPQIWVSPCAVPNESVHWNDYIRS